MSRTMLQRTYTFIINDSDRWSTEHRSAAEASGEDYDDWAASQLDQVMRAAGNAFIAEKPDLFPLGELA